MSMSEINVEEELKIAGILRDFVDFINRQVGMYSDACGAFEGSRIRVERQVHRINHARRRKKIADDGTPIVVWNSVEDPSKPDVIHNRIIRADEHIKTNAEAGINEQYTVWAIIVFLFSYWDEDVRPRIAKVRRVEPSKIKINIFGDLRILRHSIIHNNGNLLAKEHAKLSTLPHLVAPDAPISLSHDKMHSLFVAVKSAIGDLILEKTGHLPGAPKPGEMVDIAFQNFPPSTK